MLGCAGGSGMPTVLLVDDSPLARHTVARRVQAEGFDVVAEGTVAGARAVDVTTVSCAVIDIDLPDGSGVELAVELLASHPSLPIAFFTASIDAVDEAAAHGPVFHKPDVEALVAWVRSASAGPRAQPPPTK
jgi:DNA-binding response OmpR family regulator